MTTPHEPEVQDPAQSPPPPYTPKGPCDLTTAEDNGYSVWTTPPIDIQEQIINYAQTLLVHSPRTAPTLGRDPNNPLGLILTGHNIDIEWPTAPRHAINAILEHIYNTLGAPNHQED